MKDMLIDLIDPTLQTFIMVSGSTFFSLLLGFPLGILLYMTSQDGLSPKPALNQVVGRIVNLFRSFPFIILIILLFPLARFIVGTTVGTVATIVPLSIAAAPFVARIIESALKEVDQGAIQAAKVMGSTNFQIVWKVMIPEAMPSLIAGVTLTIINIIGYSAMAGAVGGGGLGDMAIREGYFQGKTASMIGPVVVIILMVEFVQIIGTKITDRILRTR